MIGDQEIRDPFSLNKHTNMHTKLSDTFVYQGGPKVNWEKKKESDSTQIKSILHFSITSESFWEKNKNLFVKQSQNYFDGSK